MPARLLACPSCARHIRVDEERCPFCSVTCPESFATSPAPVAPPRGLTRAGLVRFGAFATVGAVSGGMALGAALTASCGEVRTPATSGDATPVAPSDGALPDDAYGTSTGTGTTETSTATHPFTEPFTTTATFSAYGAPPNCGPDEIPDGGVAAPGACSGNQYVIVPIVPNSACLAAINCFAGLEGGSAAYALCADGSYSVCSAFLPSDGGWVQVELPDAGDPGDGGDGP
jgi:hypothetical protein